MALLILIVTTLCLLRTLNAQVDYIRSKGIPLMSIKMEVPVIFYDILKPDTVEALIDSHQRAIVSNVPIGLAPDGADTEILKKCPELRRVLAMSRAVDDYSYKIIDYFPAVFWDDGFYISRTKGYCGSNFPLYAKAIGKGGNETTYYPPRKELVLTGSQIMGYVWKYAHLSNKELNEVHGEVTKLQKIFYRIITTRVPQYQFGYTLDQGTLQNYLGGGYYYQPVIGLVIGGNQLSANLKKKCPLLSRVDVMKNGLLTWVGYEFSDEFTDHVKKFNKTNSFWCAPYMGYCGAYLGLLRLPSKKRDVDFLITTDAAESTWKFKYANRYNIGSPSPQTVCWIWYPHRPTMKTMFDNPKENIKKGNVRLQRGRWAQGANKGYHVYTTKAGRMNNWEKSGKVKKGYDLGYVVLENKAPLKACPSLILMKIYQEEGGNQRTFIGPNYSPRLKTKGKWVLENKFYCAPYSGYCGATKFLWAYSGWQNYEDMEYMTNATRALELEETDKFYTYQLCYIWAI